MIIQRDKTTMDINDPKLAEKLNAFLVDDNSELAQKIKINYPYFDFVIDDAGNLIDIIPTERPVINPTREEINAQVVAKIREHYSVDDEFQAQRLGMLDSANLEYQAYINYVNECIVWGDAEKAKYGYV